MSDTPPIFQNPKSEECFRAWQQRNIAQLRLAFDEDETLSHEELVNGFDQYCCDVYTGRINCPHKLYPNE